ncbi:hypothetical protein EBR78_10095 [bacterium]|nr:hypothetical protein [bacterium]NBX83609.1 hypothetical protein [bacterium]
MKKSACLLIIGLALHGSLGWGTPKCAGDKCDGGMRPAIAPSSEDSKPSDSQRPVAEGQKPEESFISGIKEQEQLNPEDAKAGFSKLDEDQKKQALTKLAELAEAERNPERAKQLADLAAELEFRSEYEKLGEEGLRAKKAELLSKIVGGKSSNAETAQARLITKMLAQRKSESSQQGGGPALATVPGTKIVRGDQRIPISVSPDGKTQFVPSKTEGIVSVSTDGGRSSTDMPESKYGLKRNADGTYSQNNTPTVSAGDPQAVGVIHRPGGKAPAFEYKYTNKEGKEVVGFENSQGQWVEGNPQANSYSKASAPAGFKVENGRLVPAEPPKPVAAPATTLPDLTPAQITTLAEKHDTALFGVGKDDATNFYLHLRSLGYSDEKAHKWALEAMKGRARNPAGVSIKNPVPEEPLR